MGNGSFVLTVGSDTATAGIVIGVHKIPQKRCYVEGAKRAVLVVRVQEGVLNEGNKIVLKSPEGKILEDVAARIEVNRMRYARVAGGTNAGILLMNHTPNELVKFGLPLRTIRTPQTKYF